MPTNTQPRQGLADSVSEETVRKLNFLTGSAAEELRNCIVVFSVAGKTVQVKIDADGNYSLIEGESLESR